MPEAQLNPEERDKRVHDLYEQLLEIEQRLIPTGLHVFGRPSHAQEKADLLRLIASFDRAESGARAVTDLVGEGLGLLESTASLSSLPLEDRERVNTLVHEAMQLFVASGEAAAETFLEQKANVSREQSGKVFALLNSVSEQTED